MGKRCLSRGVSVESPKLYSLPNGCYGGEPGEFFFPGPRRRFFSFRTSAGSFLLAFPFLLREKKRGDSGYTVRAFLLVRMILLTFFFGYKPRLYPGFRVENRVTPHSDAGSRKENLTSKLAGIPWIPHQARNDQMTASGGDD